MDLLRRRPPTSTFVYFGLAVALSLGAAVLVGSYAQRLNRTRPDVGPPAEVVVAGAPLPRGTVLSTDDLRVEAMPASLVPPGSIEAPERAVARVLVADIAEGEVLTTTRLGRTGIGPLSALVPQGLRAFSLPATVMPGSLSPGDRIDVIGTFGASGGRPYTDTVAMGLQVVRVSAPQGDGLVATTASEPNGSITVLADPDTVEILARASATGIVSFSIVGAEAA